MPLFEEFYSSKFEEKVKQDDQARKPKESESNMRLFKAYLNTIYNKVKKEGLIEMKSINPKIYTIDEL